jgi:hypothetical protein
MGSGNRPGSGTPRTTERERERRARPFIKYVGGWEGVGRGKNQALINDSVAAVGTRGTACATY